MRFNFKIQQYQTDAVNAVVNVFKGQGHYDRIRYIRDLGKVQKKSAQMRIADNGENDADVYDEYDETGYKNENIELTDEELLNNIHELQSINNIKLSEKLVKDLGRCSLDVEMETGTGKTYVYIKTMFELNKLYGWSKFIVVVPSIAIREGVKKSFEMTESHFMEYYGKKARYFVYDSSNLNKLDNFSSSFGINVMIINTQAFNREFKEGAKNKNSLIMYSKRDEFGSRRPIDVIKANRPVIILDEPQKMGGPATQAALKNFNPLFSINYSATHAKQHNLVYVLDALDAYNKKLVKKIEVKGFEVKNLRGTNSYIYIDDIILSKNKPPMVKIEFEISHKNDIKREIKKLGVNDSLYYESNEMEQYRGYTISEIDPITASVTFLNGEVIHKGDVAGDISENDMRRVQIRETIKSHFEKEEKLFNRGIKTLSLFFIDEVAKYRQYDEDGNELLGEYGKMFEQEYISVLNEYRTFFNPEYMNYLDSVDVSEIHKGYFSIDKKTGHAVDSKVKRGSEFSDDISAYDLILKNKERLLSFEEPTRFIFSHSALREGWDNPNVFQICTLKHSNSATQKHQEVGRGLRLCVNQQGNRMDAESCGDEVHDINLLTVIASESYAPFVADLQKQIKDVLYDRPTRATIEYFEGKTVFVNQKPVKIDNKQARDIYRYLIKNDYIDDDDKITQEYKDDAINDVLKPLPESLMPMEEGIHKLIQGIFDEKVLEDMIDDGNRTPVQNPLNERFYKKEFQELWKTINHKYAYTVEFDSNELIKKSVESINDNLYVSQLQYTVAYAGQRDEISADMIRTGESFENARTKTHVLKHNEASRIKYDLIGKIAEGTVLTRKTVAEILKGLDIDKFNMFKQNPEEFISKVIKLIKEQKANVIVEHITYNQIEGGYDSSIFTTGNSGIRLEKAFRSNKAIQDYVITDGTAEKSVERKFAEELEGADEVNVYAKLPKGFSIPTPVGHYSPDWAIVFNEGSVKHIYFVAETKGTMESLNLRPVEKAKIDCAKKLFEKLSDGKVMYDHVDSFETLMKKVLN